MADYNDRIKQGWLHVNVIIEILGKPKEYIQQVLRTMLEKMKKEERFEVVKEVVAEPREHEGYFTSFVDLEIVIKDMNALQEFIFAYLPSSVEIVTPTELNLSLNDANILFNNMAARLHSYDEFTKKLKVANILMTKKLREFKPDISEKDFDFGEKKKDNVEDKTEKSKDSDETEEQKESEYSEEKK
ncbi:MAG: hypothetical protein KKE23_04385 [Nanoarchaeota archaeon]|nr:hypothetical protein [Nanoarchaeota archaeon]